MALYDPFTMKKMQLSKYTTHFARCRARLSQPEYDAIINWINSQIDAIAQGEEITDSSWLPGRDWSGTPLDPLYAACAADEKVAGMYWACCYGTVLSSTSWIGSLRRRTGRKMRMNQGRSIGGDIKDTVFLLDRQAASHGTTSRKY